MLNREQKNKDKIMSMECDFGEKTLETIIDGTNKGHFAWIHGTGNRSDNNGEDCYALCVPNNDEYDAILYTAHPRVEFYQDGKLLEVVSEQDYPKLISDMIEVARKSARKLTNLMSEYTLHVFTKLTIRREIEWIYANGVYKMDTSNLHTSDNTKLEGIEVMVEPVALYAKVDDTLIEKGSTEIFTNSREVKKLVKAIKYSRMDIRKLAFTRLILPFIIGAIFVSVWHFFGRDATGFDKAYKLISGDPSYAERIVSYNDWFGIRRYGLVYNNGRCEVKLERANDGSYLLKDVPVKSDYSIDKSEYRNGTLYVPYEELSPMRSVWSARSLLRAYLLYMIAMGIALYPVYKRIYDRPKNN